MHTEEIFDLTIIGGGSTGMFASYYAEIRELKTKVIEGLPVLGGQIEMIYPEKIISDIGAIPNIKGKELVANLHKQMNVFNSTICADEEVQSIEKTDDLFVITTNQAVHYSRSVLLTTGQGAFEPRKLKLDYKERYEETNLHYYVQSLDLYRDKTVTIFGGGDSAVDWALMLEDVAKKVYLVHRRDRFRAHEASVTRLRESSIEIITPYVPKELIGDTEKIQEVILQETRGDGMIQLLTDFVIVSYGFVVDHNQLNHWGIETRNGSAIVSQQMETNIPGIYAAGDAANFEGKVNLITTGFGEVPTAINSITHYLKEQKIK